jgi:CheY-like chemotaxis protein
MVGKKRWRELAALTPDWRDLYGKAAQELNSDELSLMAEVARRMGIPFVGRVSELSLEKPTERDVALGVLPIRQGDQVIGIVTIQPSNVRYIDAKIGFERVFLSSWGVLQESLSHYMSEREGVREKRAMTVLNSVIGQAEEHDSFRVAIAKADDSLEYRMVLQNGELASGQIMPGVIEEFIDFLEKRCREGGVVMSDTPVTICRSPDGFQIDIGKGISREREIWVVEDDPSSKRVLELCLRGRGIQVRGFKSAEIALRELRQSLIAPGVILTDEHLPRMKGSEFVRAVRSEAMFSGISLMVYTSDFSMETRLNALGAGAVACIDKADDPGILLAHIEQALGALGTADNFLRSA